jgi:ubiquinone/menaquinone biosynthesis C-methylase UbiE
VKANWPEKVWVNSPLRLLIQGWETRFFRKLHPMEPGGRCLEIGCGRGAAVPLIAEHFRPRRLDALDIDHEMVGMAGARRRKVDAGGLVMAGDAQCLPYRDHCLDAVFNFGILHHLENWRLGVREIARVLRPDGWFYFEEIYPPLYANPLFRHLLAHPAEDRFHGPQFRSALEDAGLALLGGYRETRFAILGAAVKR